MKLYPVKLLTITCEILSTKKYYRNSKQAQKLLVIQLMR